MRRPRVDREDNHAAGKTSIYDVTKTDGAVVRVGSRLASERANRRKTKIDSRDLINDLRLDNRS